MIGTYFMPPLLKVLILPSSFHDCREKLGIKGLSKESNPTAHTKICSYNRIERLKCMNSRV